MDHLFGFWAAQSLKLSRNTCFRGFPSSLTMNSHKAKLERLALSKMPTLAFCVSKALIWQRILANQLGEFEYNFRCLKWFFNKLPQKLRSAFLLKLRILKIRLLVTRLKYLLLGSKLYLSSVTSGKVNRLKQKLTR